MSLSVPITTYALFFTCSETSGGCPPPLWSLPVNFSNAVTSLDWWKSLWDTKAFLGYLGWYTFCVAAWYILPGDWVEGTTLRNGGKVKYKINGEEMNACGVYVTHVKGSLLYLPFESRDCLGSYLHIRSFVVYFHL